MVNVIVQGNKLGKFESKMHTEGCSIWRINDSGTVRLIRTNLTFNEVTKLRLKNLITESELIIKCNEKYLDYL